MPECDKRPALAPDSTSSGLVRRMKDGDSEAWERLLEVYSPLVYSWCRGAGLPPADARDVLQDIFARVAEKIADFRHDQPGDTFRGWLRVMARSKIADHFRGPGAGPKAMGGTNAKQALENLAVAPSSGSAASTPWSGAIRRALTLIEAEFEERTWRAFWLATVDGRSPTDVGAELGMNPGAVRQAKYKVLRRLRLELGDPE